MCPVCGKYFTKKTAYCDICGWIFDNDITALSDPLSISADDIRAYDLRVYEARMKEQKHINDNMIAVFVKKLSVEQLNSAQNSVLAEIFNSVSPLLGDSIIKKLSDEKKRSILNENGERFINIKNEIDDYFRRAYATVAGMNGNVVNDGLFFTGDNNIFFSNANDRGCLYRTDKATDGVKRICYDECFSVFAYDNYIYYCNLLVTYIPYFLKLNIFYHIFL